MKPLVVLFVAFALALMLSKWANGSVQLAWAARIAMSCMLLFTAFGHFAFCKGMCAMLPACIPYRTELVLGTGLLEIGFAIGLLFPWLAYPTACALLFFLLLVLPANVYAAIQGVNYQTGATDGNGLSYLWFRIPLQCFFMAWVYVSAIHVK